MFFGKSHILLLSATLILGLCITPWLASAEATPTTTALAITSAEIAVDTVTAGSVVTLTAVVTAGGAPVTPGQVNFCDAAAAHCTDLHLLGTAQLTSAGTATMRFRPGIGSHSYKAVFVGTTTNAASTSNNAALTVTGMFPTTTSIAASGTAGNYNLTATVTGYMSSPGVPSPTGSLSFLDAANGYFRLGTAELGTSAASTALSFRTSQSLLTGNPSLGDTFQLAVVGDFNGDGIEDLVTVSYLGTLTIFLGQGNGTFTQTTTSLALLNYRPDSVAVGDFNGDGNLDLAVADRNPNYCPTYRCRPVGPPYYVTIFLGNGDGTFAQVMNSSWWESEAPVTIVDLNGDGIPDLVAAYGYPSGQFSGTINVLLGNGDGTFADPQDSPVRMGSVPYSFTVGDFNGDGVPDVAVASQCGDDLTCQSGGSIGIFLGKGDGTFRDATNRTASGGYWSDYLVKGDFNSDGVSDLAVVNRCGIDPTCESGGSVSILLGNGDGTFREATDSPVPVGVLPFIGVVGDSNGDGVSDLAVVNECGIDPIACESAGTISILLGNGDGTFREATNSPVSVGNFPSGGDYPVFIATGDFNGNGISDYVVFNGKSVAMVVLSQVSQSASATVTGISPLGSGTHNIYAGYDGDENYAPSVSASTPLIAQQATPTITVTPSSMAISTAQPLSVTVAVSGGAMDLTPSGSITLTSGSFTSATTVLSNGGATISVPVGSLTAGTATLTASYSGDSNFSAAVGTASITVTNPSFTITGTTVTIAAGAVTGNASTITVTPIGGFTGQVALTAALTAAPVGAQYPPILSFGSTNSINITDANSGTATLTISTTGATRAALEGRREPGVFWYMTSSATLACLLFLGIPARRYGWLRMLSLFAILTAFAGGIFACGGKGGGTSISGTTAGTYTVTVTAKSGSTTVTCPFAVIVQ